MFRVHQDVIELRSPSPAASATGAVPFGVQGTENAWCLDGGRTIGWEMARRFGVNLAMYALTGNYKTDQVHVPALLERLGQ